MNKKTRKKNKEKCSLVYKSILQNRWLSEIDDVSFLASGEYNENYIVSTNIGKFVFRINHGSQLDREDQIGYEFGVLKAVQPSGVTPVPYFVNSHDQLLGSGVLLMEYLYGRPLIYARDMQRAAYIFSQIHSLPVPDSGCILCQEDPVKAIACESRSLLNRFPEHPLAEERKILLEYYCTIIEMADRYKDFFKNEPLCIVNTEVNSGNFIVNRSKAYLVDWEKAVVSCRYQDLGHFLVPTTTLWKSGYVYSAEEKRDFLKMYCGFLMLEKDYDSILEKTELMEKVILLRALSWCYMAYYEYTRQDRALANKFTFSRIRKYLADIKWFLR